MVYFLLIVGFILLVKGADLFVDGSAALAKRFNIPSVIIGLTVVAFGTSAPEAAVSIAAAMKGSNDIAVANVVGSNIFNLLMVVGISALISPLIVKKSMLKTEFPLSIIISVILLVMCISVGGNEISRIDGIVLLIIFAAFIYYLIHQAISSNESTDEEFKEMSLFKSFIFIAVGLTGIILGGDVVVDKAKIIAKTFGMSDMLVGLTIVSIGTSLPELVTSIVAGLKGESDIALGNVVGSNIFNILLVLGMSSVIRPIAVSAEAVTDIIYSIIIAIIVYIMSITGKKVSRSEGAVMVAIYAAYMSYIIIR